MKKILTSLVAVALFAVDGQSTDRTMHWHENYPKSVEEINKLMTKKEWYKTEWLASTKKEDKLKIELEAAQTRNTELENKTIKYEAENTKLKNMQIKLKEEVNKLTATLKKYAEKEQKLLPAPIEEDACNTAMETDMAVDKKKEITEKINLLVSEGTSTNNEKVKQELLKDIDAIYKKNDEIIKIYQTEKSILQAETERVIREQKENYEKLNDKYTKLKKLYNNGLSCIAQKENAELKSKVSKQEEELSKLAAIQEENAECKAKADNYEEENAKLKSQISELKSQVANLTNSEADIKSRSIAVEEPKEEVSPQKNKLFATLKNFLSSTTKK
jgi:DNA repair exonuclease SbcCD ATPase subunit